MSRVLRDGFLWPKADRVCGPLTMATLPDLGKAVALTPERGLALQAGGCVGVWAAHLALSFERVVTVEPDTENLGCLIQNVPGNVEPHWGALGAVPGRTGMAHVDYNTGAHFVRGAGRVPVITVDGLALPRLDLLVLDIEGCELQALQGAASTLTRHRPVIMIEARGHETRYGQAPGAALDWLQRAFGYRVHAEVGSDVILTA
ncbi:FkbM family methyltransferase [Jannaschia formosa]|uniref:FkbM family methyltransferase n=1 Tax=Jannaschia formosa TaxID=2259592 RepID=UPI000E1BADE5|nr:FkbM family methyltransferase [Jannaschia formosa]TFL16431.1 FkbM family methyltransferase [Jannaschia formosa]